MCASTADWSQPENPVTRPAGQQAAAPDVCIHCGSGLGAFHEPADGPFCCRGCKAVHELLDSENLTRYYDLRQGAQPPAPVLRPDSFAWFDRLLDELPASVREEGPWRLSMDLQGVHCAACVWLLEELFRREEKQLIKLAYLIAEKVVHQRIEQDEEVALKVAEQVLLKTMRDDQLRIQLNPQDEAMFKDRGSSVAAIAARLENLTIETNPKVQRGGCIVTTPMGEIDATIDNQFYLVKNELMEENE